MRSQEAALRARFGLTILQGLGFESAPASTLVSKMQKIRPDGSTAMRDSIIQGTTMMLKLYEVLSECQIAEHWNFVHVVLTDGADNHSKANLEYTAGLMALIGQTIPVNMLKTWIIGVDIGNDLRASREIASLVLSGGENTEFANISDANIEDIFTQLTVSLGLATRYQVEGIRFGNHGLLSVEEQEVALLSLEQQHYVVLFNLDISGSMESRWGRVCRCVEKFVQFLGPEDLVAGLVFNEKVQLITKPQAEPPQRSEPVRRAEPVRRVAINAFDAKFHQQQKDFRTAVKKLSMNEGNLSVIKRGNNVYRALKNAELGNNQNQAAIDASASKDPNEYLRMGRRLSDDFKAKLKLWIEKEKTLILKDNFLLQASNIIKEVLKKEKVAVRQAGSQDYFCDVCQKNFQTKEVHDCQFIDAYTTILRNTKVPKLDEMLKNLVGNKIWEWEPLNIGERPQYLVKLEEISKSLESNLRDFKKVAKLVDQTVGQQLLTYFENRVDPNLMKSIADAATVETTTPAQLTNQKPQIQFVVQNTPQAQAAKPKLFKKESASRTTYGDIKIVPLNNGFIDGDRVPAVKIGVPPQWIPDNQVNECAVCHERFSFFHRRHHCRACGGIFCSNCIVQIPLFKYGYEFPVKVCRPCQSNLKKENALIWIDHSKELARKGFKEDAEKCLFISTCYDADVNDKMAQIGDDFLNEGHYELMIKSYAFVNLDLKKWMKLAEKFCQKKDFAAAINCIHSAKTLRKVPNNQLIASGDEYVNAGLNMAGLSNLPFHEVLSLFCYLEGDMKTKDIILKSIKHEQNGNYNLPGFYLAYASAKRLNQDEWNQLGKAMLDAQCYRAALYCYHQAKLPIRKWIDVIEGCCEKNPPNYELATQLIDAIQHLYQPNWRDTSVNGEFTHYFTCIKGSQHEMTFDSMLDRYLDLVQNKSKVSRLVMCILFAIDFGKVFNFSEESKKYLMQSDFPKALICFSLSKLLEGKGQSWTKFAEQMLSVDEHVAFLCFAMDCTSWRKLGDSMFERERYKIALNCYLKTGDGDIFTQIHNCARQLVEKEEKMALMYYAQLYKNGKFITETVQGFCQMYPAESRKDILIATMQRHDNNYEDRTLPPLHVALASILENESRDNSIKAAIGAYHFSAKQAKHKEASLASVAKLQQLIKGVGPDDFYHMLKGNIEESKPKELAALICNLDESKLEAVKSVYKQHIGDQDVSELPPHQKCYAYLLSAAMKIYQRQLPLALIDLRIALICYPVGEIPEAIAIMLQNEGLQMAAYQAMTSDLEELVGAGFKKLNAFCNAGIPETCHYQDLLKGSPLLTKIRQFEKAVNGAPNDSLKCAMFYLDICGEIEDAATLAGCFVMAGLHFLNAQKQTKNEGEIYAYRNAIVEIMLTASSVGMENLTPSMQIYINKISLIAILHANQNLSASLQFQSVNNNRKNSAHIIDSHNEQLINGLVTNILRKSLLAPITKLPTSYSCDTAYLDLACRSYSQHYLKGLTDDRLVLCPKHLADYYQFEGAWKQWLPSEEDLDQLRIKSMKSLVQAKGLNMQSIQKFVDWPAVTKTVGGWLDDTKQKLSFHTKSFSKVIGMQVNEDNGSISLLLQEASNGDGLFTSLDIYNVLVFGIKGALLTTERADSTLPAHPFQEVKYYPKELAQTDYLATMMHADNLVKMIAEGVEVSSAAPFNMKKAYDGFMRRVPESLRATLQPVADRSHKKFAGEDMNQFWIDAGELKYNYAENNGVSTYLFGDVKMEVKQNLMKLDSNGNLADFVDNQNNDSAEAEFARTFTKHYEELGKYFPSLLRLKELVKISALHACIQRTYQKAKEVIASGGIDINQVNNVLSQIKANIDVYPKNTANNVGILYREVLRDNGISEYRLTVSAQENIKADIRAKLQEQDREELEKATGIIANQFNVSRQDIRLQVQKWLEGSANDLVDKIVSLNKKPVEERYSKILKEIDSLDFRTDSNQNVQLGNEGECSWTPLAVDYSRRAMRNTRPGGGVHLGVNLVQDTHITANGQTYKNFNVKDIVRTAKEGDNNNFPKMNNNNTFTGQKNRISSNYCEYSNSGTFSGRAGTFELGVKSYKTSQGKNVEVITQRSFRPNLN